MGALSAGLIAAARAAGAQLRTDAEVTDARAGDDGVTVACADGDRAPRPAPAVRRRPGRAGPAARAIPPPTRRPRARSSSSTCCCAGCRGCATPRSPRDEAFAGTLHVNEGYDQLETAYREAERGEIPALPPCEAYCHSLTDPSILSPELRAAGAQTLTVFGLHMPARLFAADHDAAKARAVQATLGSLDAVLDEPIADCLWTGPDGEPCLEARTPYELEHELALPAGHIFHRDLAWPFAEAPARPAAGAPRPSGPTCGCAAPARGGAAASAGSPGTTRRARCSPPTRLIPGLDRCPGLRAIGQWRLGVSRNQGHGPTDSTPQPHRCAALPERRHRAGGRWARSAPIPRRTSRSTRCRRCATSRPRRPA